MARHTFRPSLDTLEAREVPAVSIYTMDGGHTLRIVGSKDWDSVAIVQNDDTNTLEVSSYIMPKAEGASASDIASQTFSSSAITKIQVDLGMGDDEFSYRLADGTNLNYGKQLNVNTGTGNDSVRVDLASPAVIEVPVEPSSVDQPNGKPYLYAKYTVNHDIIEGDYDASVGSVPTEVHSKVNSKFSLTLDTGNGDDRVDVAIGELSPNVKVCVTANLGCGDDRLSLNSDYEIASNAKLLINVDGGLGDDSLETNFHGTIDQGALVDVQLWGKDGNDYLYTGLFGIQKGQFNVAQQGESGNDDLNFYSELTPESTGHSNVTLFGHSGDDTITYCGLGTDNPALVNVNISGGRGYNIGKLSRDVAMLHFDEVVMLSVI